MDNAEEFESPITPLDAEKRRLVVVLTFIENVCKLEDPTATVEEHRGFVGWESDLRGLPGIS